MTRSRILKSLAVVGLLTALLVLEVQALGPSGWFFGAGGGGGGHASGGGLALDGTAGLPATDLVSGGGYQLQSGVWYAAEALSAAPDNGVPPLRSVLHAPAPNPFNPATTVAFETARTDRVRLRVYDLRGRLVRELQDEVLPAGRHEARWNGLDDRGGRAASGTYFLIMEAGAYLGRQKLMLVK